MASSEAVAATKSPLGTWPGAFLAGLLALLGSFCNYLTFYSYPLLTAEVAIGVGALGAIALLVALLYASQRFLGRAILEAILLLLLLDVHFDQPLVTGLASLLALALLLWRRISMLPLLAITGGVMLLASLTGLSEHHDLIETSNGTQQPARSIKPAVIHIILDEHIGIEGAAHQRGGMPGTDRMLSDFYGANGFRVYTKAYSRHLQTVNSIPHILNLGHPVPLGGGYHGIDLSPNRYFERLIAQGYRLKILQAEFVNYCRNATFQTCTTYRSPSPQLLPSMVAGASTRASILLFKFIELSDVMVSVGEIYDLIVGPALGLDLPLSQPSQNARTSSLAALGAFDRLASDVRSARPGEMYFAHILLPHDPYTLGADCAVLPWDQWLYRFSPTTIQRRENAYGRQARCATKKIGEVLQALSASPAGSNALVIIHGDHGSRIVTDEPLIENRGRFGDSDLVAGHSTLFAVRGPGIAPGFERSPAALGPLISSLVSTGFSRAPEGAALDGSGEIQISDNRWVPRASHRLPAYWLNGKQASPAPPPPRP